MAETALTPDPWWADEEYDQSCPTCGALIDHGKKKLHQDWHDAILSEARSYVDPPRYGGYR